MNSYQLSYAAELDLTKILQYSYERHGERQMLKYNAQLKQCFENISIDSNFNLYKAIERNGKVIRSLRCQEHYIFALLRSDKPLLIIAILHSKMDLMNRLKDRLGSSI